MPRAKFFPSTDSVSSLVRRAEKRFNHSLPAAEPRRSLQPDPCSSTVVFLLLFARALWTAGIIVLARLVFLTWYCHSAIRATVTVTMIRYTVTIFLSAFLLFQVQPLVGKYILPWFGGTPAVWTACMLFFQTLLVFGYAYAHGLARLRPRTQVLVHVVVLAATALLMPITPSADWKPVDASNPTGRIFLLLLVCVGGPYVVLSATAPLLQSWFARAQPGRSPYRLYALSNAGSLLGLFAYPFVAEPTLSIGMQTWAWSIAYGVFLIMCGLCALELRNLREAATMVDARHEVENAGAAAAGVNAGVIAMWLALSAAGSIMLLATTNKMCQDVASVPLLWVLPLGVYLLSFILMFGHERWYNRNLYAVGMILAVMAAAALAILHLSLGLVTQVLLLTYILAVSCSICQGELVRLKPGTRYLTAFYVMIAVGGALGGVFVTLLAPLLFDGYYEFNFGLVACMGLLLLQFRRDSWVGLTGPPLRKEIRKTSLAAVAIGLVMLVMQWSLSEATSDANAQVLEMDRNFYGSVRVTRHDECDEQLDRVVMTHGNTIHGVQFQNAAARLTPTMYYTRASGVGLAIEQHPCRQKDNPLRVGVIGLGAGTLSCYAREHDIFRYYEIDPLVAQMAEQHFTFLADARDRGADVQTWLGDARIVMERQLTDGQPQQFDVLVVDAFSSDSIPLHLLTVECFELYRLHLATGGVLAVHVSNRYLDLCPAVRGLALANEHALWVQVESDTEVPRQSGNTVSEWVLLTSNEQFLANPLVQAQGKLPDDLPRVHLTDSFSSLFALLRW